MDATVAGGEADAALNRANRGLIWKTDRFAVHDGPGIRTSVYFQGCPLRCPWCSNPEGQMGGRELLYVVARCDGCGRCVGVCPRGAIGAGTGENEGGPQIHHEACDGCGECARICPTQALSVPARFWTAEELLDLFERDRPVYRRSGGGVTCTGGEPLRQAPFVAPLLAECRRRGLHTVVETCGFAGREALAAVLPHVDQMFFDLKHMDENEHERLISRSNQSILANLRLASTFFHERGGVFVVRYVVVPGMNDGETIVELAKLVATLPHVDYVELLPLHAYGSYKYAALGRMYGLEGHRSPSPEDMERYRQLVEGRECKCIIGNV